MSDFKFLKHYRLSKKKDISNVFENGISVSDGKFVVYALRNNLDFSRVCIVTSKKSNSIAVKRNKIRRLAREFFRLNRSTFTLIADYVIIARKNAYYCNYADTEKSLKKLFFSKGLLKNDKKNAG
ncbi:MAG TPA: ribonuclease P protein component [bacterium]|nr:ribonuclease P protein component [bacterium]HPN32491.1 ribonuclease P protein component [bacterium]